MTDPSIDPQEAYRLAVGFLTAIRHRDEAGIAMLVQTMPHEGYVGAVIGALSQMLLAALAGDVDENLARLALSVEEITWPQ